MVKKTTITKEIVTTKEVTVFQVELTEFEAVIVAAITGKLPIIGKCKELDSLYEEVYNHFGERRYLSLTVAREDFQEELREFYKGLKEKLKRIGVEPEDI